MYQKNGKSLFKLSALALAVSGAVFVAGCSDDDDDNNVSAEDGTPTETSSYDSDSQALTRLATVPLGAEVTGLFLSEAGDLFFNVQHPSDSNTTLDSDGNVFSAAAVGVIRDADFSAEDLGFNALSVPASAEEKELVRTAIGSYDVLAQNGDAWAGAPTGGLGAINTIDGQTLKVSNDPDFNAFISTGTEEGYLFTNWEDRPGGMSRMKVRKDDSGNWNVVDNDVMMIDFSSVAGTWVNCFGTLSPWGNPLTSEELYFDDTSEWNNPSEDNVSVNTYLDNYLGAGDYPNPYRYGFIVEITEPTAAAPVPVKMMSMGRFSHENAVVMPDEKTVYMSDDGTDTVFFKFVADTAGDLTSGTLYAAKATQDDAKDPSVAGFDLEWIELASGDNATIEAWVAEYDGVTQGDYTAGSTSYISDEEIQNWASVKLGQQPTDIDGDSTIETGDDRVAFLESRKAAKALGATAEFRKMEGVNINLAGAADGSVPYAYMAMANFNKGMGDDVGDIQLDAANGDCGVVYQMPLSEGFNITRMEPAIVGGPYNADATANNCSVDNISEPDNILVLRDGRVLIGEDTGEHENNMLWLFDPEA